MARTLRKEWDGILSWWGLRSTNAILEGLNSLIQSIKRAVRGFKNTSYFETMILLRLGKLDFTEQMSWHLLPTRNVEDPVFLLKFRQVS